MPGCELVIYHFMFLLVRDSSVLLLCAVFTFVARSRPVVLSEMRESRKMGERLVGECDNAMTHLISVQRFSSRPEGDTHLDGQRNTYILRGS